MFHAESGCSLGTHWRCSISWEMAFDPFGGAIRCKMYVVFMMETGIAKRSFEHFASYRCTFCCTFCCRYIACLTVLFAVISFELVGGHMGDMCFCFGYALDIFLRKI